MYKSLDYTVAFRIPYILDRSEWLLLSTIGHLDFGLVHDFGSGISQDGRNLYRRLCQNILRGVVFQYLNFKNITNRNING